MLHVMQAETETLELKVEQAVAGGRCLARHDGKVVLVAGALPGERVRVRLTREDKRFAEGEAVEILEPHPSRREAPCPHAADCGGCDFQTADRDLQLAMKRQIVVDAFRRIAKMDVETSLVGPEAVGPEFGWRNRLRLSFDPSGRPGLLRRASHDVIGIDDCLLMTPEFGKTLLPWMRLLPPWKKAGVRFDSEGRAVLLLESGNPPNERDRRRFGKLTKGMEPPPSLIGVLTDQIPLAGKRELTFRVRQTELKADAANFFQVNPGVTEHLVGLVEAGLGEERGLLLDLYAGVGLFAACLGRGFQKVIASEADSRAARYLKKNLKRAGFRSEARPAESAEVTLREVPREAMETVILDPPRIGLSAVVRQELIRRAPRRIVSVSCDPATAARDVAALVAAGWNLDRLTAVDLFPVTAHVETVAVLTRAPEATPDVVSAPAAEASPAVDAEPSRDHAAE
jgi:tRNA/tmRNA/rRNA uracil-C5-methylase (TrmA/RlmC/RlmD family)